MSQELWAIPPRQAGAGELAPYLRQRYDDEGDWTLDAVCSQFDPEIFFPEIGSGVALARSICATCPVRLPCLDAALEEEDGSELTVYGVRGGLGASEREKILRARRNERLAQTGRALPPGTVRRGGHGYWAAS